MANVISIDVPNPDEMLNTGAYGTAALIRVQNSTTEGGVYADLSGSGSTPTLTITTLVNTYTAYDPVGTSSVWYRTRYENTGGTRLSDWSAVFQVGAEEAGKLCSIYDVERRLVQSGSALNDDEREQIISLITEVSDYIAGYTGRRFTPDPLSDRKSV